LLVAAVDGGGCCCCCAKAETGNAPSIVQTTATTKSLSEK